MANFNLQDFGQRLKQARIREKLSLEALSQKLDGIVTKQAISKYEKGLMAPSSRTLIALAEALNYNIDYFFKPINSDLQNLDVSFRKKSNIGAKDVAALKIEIQDDIEKFLEIEKILGVDSNHPVELTDVKQITSPQDMVSYAQALRQLWKLGNAPISNIQDTLEGNGIKVIFCKGPAGFDGVSGVVNNDTLIIVLNIDIDMVERQRFTAFHELAHILFNKHIDPSLSKHDKEKICDAFANEMLVPSEVLHSFFDGKKKIALEELAFVQEQYGISIDAIMHKLAELQIISDKRYRNYNIRKNVDDKLKEYVEKSRFTEVRVLRFEPMVYSALANELITESKAASLLGVPIEGIRRNLTLV